MNNLQAIAALFFSAIIGFVGGASMGAKHERTKQEAEIARILKSQQADRIKMEQTVADAVDGYAKDLASLSARNADLSARIERMRKSGSSSSVGTGAVACGVERAAVRRCENLLHESARLLGEGADLLGRNATAHDNLVKTLK